MLVFTGRYKAIKSNDFNIASGTNDFLLLLLLLLLLGESEGDGSEGER